MSVVRPIFRSFVTSVIEAPPRVPRPTAVGDAAAVDGSRARRPEAFLVDRTDLDHPFGSGNVPGPRPWRSRRRVPTNGCLPDPSVMHAPFGCGPAGSNVVSLGRLERAPPRTYWN